jgi:acyl-CoA thioesterase-1
MTDRPRPSRRAVVAAVGLIGLGGRLAAADRPIRIVAFGDSLTAGYGLPADRGFVARRAAARVTAGVHAEVIGAGVSGDTTDMGLARLDWSVPADADAVIVELGANDALRGLPPEEARRNLDEIVGRLRGRGQQVLIAGMVAPRNLGPAYAAAFDPIFADVAARHDALLYPFFLDGVALDPTVTLPDGLHPNSAGIDRIVERILPRVLELVARVADRRR